MKSKKASHHRQPKPPAALLTSRNPEDLRAEMQQVQLTIARRAYELFQTRGCEPGHDWEDWFRAKSELLRPVSVSIAESNDRISVRADVAGFDQTELKVSIEPHCITILGQKKTSRMKDEAKTMEPTGSYPDKILEVVELAPEVTPKRAVVKLQDGVLKFELPTAATNEVEVVPAA